MENEENNTVEIDYKDETDRNLENDVEKDKLSPKTNGHTEKKSPPTTKRLMPQNGDAIKTFAKKLSQPNLEISEEEKQFILRKFSAPTLNATDAKPHNGALLNPIETNPLFVSNRLPQNIDTNSWSRDIRRYLNDKFKCTICKNPFKDPRVLDCLHFFCLQCLVEVLEAAKTGDASNLNYQNVQNVQSTKSTDNSEFDGSGKASDSTSFPLSMSAASSTDSRYSLSSIKKIEQKPKDARRNSVKPPKKRRQSSLFVYTAKPLQCPICSYATEIPPDGVKRLPQNLMINRKMEVAMASVQGIELQAVAVWCGLCDDEIVAIAFCLNCNINLCNFCKEAHLRQRNTAMHDVRFLTELKEKLAKADNTSVGKKTYKCFVHPMHDLKLFCTTCQQVACSECTILSHRGHKCEPITKASKIYLRMVKDALERTRPLCDYATDSISKLNGVSRKINQRADLVQNDVEIFLAEYLDALEVHRKTLLKQIGRAKEAKLQIIIDHQSDLLRRSTEAKTAIRFTEELFADGSDCEMLSFVSLLLRRFDHCQRSKIPLDPKISDSLQFLQEVRAPSTKAQHNIPIYGIITTQTAVPKFCVLENTESLLFLRVHRKAELVMIAKDNDNRPLCHGGLILTVIVRYKDVSARILNTQVSDKRDGSYLISFIPDAAGVLAMEISIQGKHIKDSPFNLCARALRPHSGIFHCCTFCSSSASKTATCACEGRMPGGYKGCGHGHEGHPGRRHWSCCASDLESSECSATNAVK